MMLEGEIDIYPRFHPTSEWDTSSGQGLLESIGGGLLFFCFPDHEKR
jgi:3'(2'), 5'-bisphosphate nucleotidase